MKAAAGLTALALFLMSAAPAFAQVKLTPDEEAAFERALEIMGDDPGGARKLIEPLADKGDGESLNFLATLIQYGGPGWEPDEKRAGELREAAVKAGSEAAAMNIAIGLMMDSRSDHARAVELLKIADTDEKLKQITAYPWGRAYLFGWGVERDMAKGVAYLEVFAASNASQEPMMPDAQFLLGRAYQNGWGVAADDNRAYPHMLQAAELGDTRAQWQVGMMLIQGAGVAKDDVKAYGFVSRSTEGGYLPGMVSRAVMLATGEGVAENDVEAREWYFEAAMSGSAHGLRGLGGMVLTGEGGQADVARGLAMLELAAEAGDTVAPRMMQFVEPGSVPRADIDARKREWVRDFGLPDRVN